MWSKKYEKCVVCGTIKKKHKGHGMCKSCYQKYDRKLNLEKFKERNKKYRENNCEKIKKSKKKYYEENPEKIKEQKRKSYKRNLEKHKERSKKYRENNYEKIKENKKEWYNKNLERIKEYNKKYRENNYEKIKETNKKWREKNLKKNKKYKKIYHTKKCHNDFRYKLKNKISKTINKKLKKRLLSKKGKSTFSFLPYTIDDLIKHLESLFTEGMTWENHGTFGWHIDHKKPESLFNYKSVEDKEFQECWALKNLQPLWWLDNIKKSNKYDSSMDMAGSRP